MQTSADPIGPERLRASLQRLRVAVREGGDLGAVGPRDLGRLLHRVVRLLVEGDGVLPAGQARDRPEVRQHHRGVDQDRLDPQPVGELLLGLDVRPDAGEGPRRAVVRPPPLQPAADRVLDPRVLVEPEEAVRAEVDQPAAVDLDPTARARPRRPRGPSGATSGCSAPNCSMILTSVFWRRASAQLLHRRGRGHELSIANADPVRARSHRPSEGFAGHWANGEGSRGLELQKPQESR